MLSEAMVKLGQHEGAGMAHRRHLTPSLFHDSRRRNVGLIGGSFNPAHDGHLHMAMLARKILGLDEIWWMVTPQNPLKPSEDMSLLQNRLAYARKLVGKRTYLRVIAPELGARNNYTFNTLNLLLKVAPRVNFVWIMGADNLIQFHKWHRYRDIVDRIPIAVIDRPGYSYPALSVGRLILSRRVPARRLGKLERENRAKPPIWCFISERRHHASATALRALGLKL
jgi:nicotinate-nucleotide adenylyltransferase